MIYMGGQLAARGPHVARQSVLVAHDSVQEKSSNLKIFGKCVRLHMSHSFACVE